jgi:hypothetical protein
MSIQPMLDMIDRRYRRIVYVMVALAGGSWLLLGAVGKFTSMVDERARAVVDAISAAPLAEHKEFTRRLGEHDKLISDIAKNQGLMDRNLTRLMALQEQR